MKIRNGAAFTLIEILIAITVILVLAAILLPVIFRVKLAGYKSVSINNTRQILQAIEIYAADNGDRIPFNLHYPSGYWMADIGLVSGGQASLRDPMFTLAAVAGSPYESVAGYAINACLRSNMTNKSIVDPAVTILIAPAAMFKVELKGVAVAWHPVISLATPDTLHKELLKRQYPGWTVTTIGSLGSTRYFDSGVYGFVDSHVSSLRPGQIERMPDDDSCGFRGGLDAPSSHSGPTFVARQG